MTIQDLNAPLYAASLAGLLIILQTALMLTVGLYRGRIGQFVDDSLQLFLVGCRVEVLDTDRNLGLHRIDCAARALADAGFAVSDSRSGSGVGRIRHYGKTF